MSVYCGRTERGMTLVVADTRTDAFDQVAQEVGYGEIQSVQLATAEDVSWIKAMGGWVPEEARTLVGLQTCATLMEIARCADVLWGCLTR